MIAAPVAVDSRGDIYVGEVSWTAWPQIYPGRPHPANLRSLEVNQPRMIIDLKAAKAHHRAGRSLHGGTGLRH